ncbi:MAG: DUF3858 domain-containing protein [Flavobacteriaceae bacterium]
MKKSFKLFTMLLLFVVTGINAQNYKFGKVSKEELLEKNNPNAPSSSATVLFRKQHVSFDYEHGIGFIQKNEIHERIKVYTKEGFEYATKTIDLYNESNNSKESLVGLKAITYNINSGKIRQTKLTKDGIFNEETNDYWRKVKFTLPNIKEGSVIEYKYTIESQMLGIDDVYLQQMIPIKKLELKVKTPEYFQYKMHQNLMSSYLPDLQYESKERKILITGLNNSAVTHGKRPSDFKRSELVFIENWTVLDAENIPALANESYVSSLKNYAASIKIELQQMRLPNSPLKSFSTTWEKVTKTIYTNSGFGGELSKESYYKKDLDALLAGKTSSKDIVTTVFNYVKSKVRHNNLNGYYVDNGVRKAYKDGEGNVADINLMLVSMLRYAGIDANPVLISTVDNGTAMFPTKKGFNYVICHVSLNNGTLLLDATNKYSVKNIIDTDALNWKGRLVRKDGSSDWVEILPNKNSNLTTMISVKLNEDLIATGKVRDQKTLYKAYEYRNKYQGVKDEDLLKSISSKLGSIDVSNLELKNQLEIEKPIQSSYDFEYEDGVEEVNNELYIQPLMFLSKDENLFNNDKRNYPVNFGYPKTEKAIVNIEVPNGYKVKTLPQSVKLMMSDNVGDYNLLVKQSGNKIQVSQTLNINYSMISVAYYKELQAIYKTMIEKNAEKIVLEKI